MNPGGLRVIARRPYPTKYRRSPVWKVILEPDIRHHAAPIAH